MKNVDGKIIKIVENFRIDALGLEFFRFIKYKCSGYEIANQIQMSEERALGYLRNCLEGLVVLEQAGYCHTDLKPSNILITSDYSEAHLCDLEHLQEIGSKNLRKHFGTFHYNPPERAFDKIMENGTRTHSNSRYKTDLKLEITPKLDMWSLGLTFVEMLTGRHPFESITEPSVLLSAHVSFNVKSVLEPDVVSEAETIDLVSSMLAFWPADRPNLQQALAHKAFDKKKVRSSSTLDSSGGSRRKRTARKEKA